MKNIAAGIGTIILAMIFLNMGGSPGDIPTPKKNYSGTFIDTDGIKSEVANISFHGEVFLDGERGKAIIAIPFDKISRLDFSPNEGEGEGTKASSGAVSVTIHLKDGTTTDVRVRKVSKWFGKTRYGSLTIKSADLGAIVFSQ